MKTDYINRKCALNAYKHYRKTWDRVASLMLTYRHWANDPIKRLSAAITLAAYQIPQDGVYKEIRK